MESRAAYPTSPLHLASKRHVNEEEDTIQMATTTQSLHRATVSLKLPAKVADLIAYATGVVHSMSNNAAFPAPVPALAAISAAVSDLQAAETVALTRARGAATARNGKRA